MLQTKNLRFNYNNGKTFTFPDIKCDSRERLLILGQSGVGKSTLLHLIGGLMNPTDGNIIIDSKDLKQMTSKQLDKFRGDNIGIIFQKNHFVEALSVLENMTLAQYLAGRKEEKDKCLKLLERLNIQHKAGSKINRLSQGEQQRVAIARSVVNDPIVILADEPTSALDDHNCHEVIGLLEEQAEYAGAALVIVTHDARLKDHISHQIILS